ncbi:hypothetical protein BDZ91DRAFT_801116 [Kalaharituber pfeilii]|nr:hypothetical protein BDZ91DRAFT_801116 [Kalaharituber pfeilii]
MESVIGWILKGVENYATIIDVAIQHHPEITALVAVDRFELMENLEWAMATIVEGLPHTNSTAEEDREYVQALFTSNETILDDISTKEEVVRECADVATMKRIMD